MKEFLNKKNKDKHISILIIISLVFLITVEFLDFSFISDQFVAMMIKGSVSRIIGGVVFILIIVGLGYSFLYKHHMPWKTALLLIMPMLLVSIYNFPFIAYFNGNAEITSPISSIYIFVFHNLSTSFFEEIVFRGLILILLLKKLPNTKKGIFIAILLSSAVFGIVHILNIFTGAGLYNTVLQVGYSFLVGMMWAVVYLSTKNIWLTILLHAVYNFTGQVLFALGIIQGRFDIITIVTTTILAIVVGLYSLYLYFKLDLKEVRKLYQVNQEA